MNTQMKTLIAICGALALFILVLAGMYISANNGEIGLRNQFNAQQKNNESSFDKTWKVIQQQAGVAETERETFRETFVEIMQSQQGIAGKGSLASFFTQAKIDVSPELFLKLMTTIEAQRESFHRDQQKLLEIVRLHDDIRMKLPSSLFVGGRSALEAKIITSSKTKDVFSSSEDNDIELFKKQ